MSKSPKTFAELFASAVAIDAEGVALRFRQRSIPYRELDRLSDDLAARLHAQGLRAGGRAVVWLPRGVELVASVLAVSKLGAHFVPVDIHTPARRVQAILEQARPDIFLNQEKLLALSASARGTEIGRATVDPRETAYIIFTSGSSGRPKGVVVSHVGLRMVVDHQQEFFGSGPGRRVLQYAPSGFDTFIWELCMSVLCGGTLCIPDLERVLPSPELTEFIESEGCHLLTMPPSNLRLLPKPGRGRLDTIIVAGEACPPDLPMEWARGRRIFNSYGPTESTICATVFEVAPTLYEKRVPIGKAIAGWTIHLLNEQGAEVSPGETGEIYIGGPAIAGGYLDEPEKTARQFVADPFSREPGARLFRTRDLALVNARGELEFLGRSDDQVKINGVRVELEEIDGTIKDFSDSIVEAVTTKVELDSVTRLVSFFTAADAIDPDALREHLRERLLAVMVPFRLIQLNAFPFTTNGKIDFAQLRALVADEPSPALASAHEQGQEAIRQNLLRLWRASLHREPVTDRSFLAAGGTSLELVRLHHEIDRLYPGALSVAEMLQHLTLDQWVAKIAERTLAAPASIPIVGL